jgi:hypothetical protein
MKLRETIWALAFVLLFCATAVRAQSQDQGSQPVTPIAPFPPADSIGSGGRGKPPAAAARGVSSGSDSGSYDPSQVLPDDNTLSGAQFFGVGSLEHAHNIFDPSFSITDLGETNPGNVVGQTNLSATAILNGGLAFDRVWSINHLTMNYNGGESFIAGPLYGGAFSRYSQFHNLTVIQQMTWERWHVLLRDDFTASPGAVFTGTGMGGPGLIEQFSTQMSAALSSFGQAFLPNETIETGNIMRYRNSVLGQAEYSFTRRTAFTFSGSYGLLDFTDAGYINSQMLNAQAGYDYLLDPSNSIAVLASYGRIDFTFSPLRTTNNVTASTTNYMAGLAFGRKITGRLAFQAEAGPEQIRVADAAGDYAFWIASANSALIYDRRRGGVTFSFLRGLGAGSGVFLGSVANTFTGSGRYEFTRFLTGSVNGGYAMNKSLAPAGMPTLNFNNWFIGANLRQMLGEHYALSFNYGVQHQGAVACPVANCGVPGYQQTFGMTVNWHLRPVG